MHQATDSPQRPSDPSAGGAEALNSLILASSRDCIVLLDLEGRNRYVSPGGIEAMEIDDVAAILGLSWLRVWQGKDAEAAVAALAEARAGRTARFQGFCPTHRGTPKWWDMSVSRLPAGEGRPEQLVSIGRDITDMKRAEQQLAASEAQFRGFAQAMPNQMWTAPADGLLDWCNDRVYAYSGHTESELLGTGWARMVHGDDLPSAAGRWAAALASGQGYDTEFRLRRADGEYRWHIGRALPIRNAEGAITRWIGTNTDISEQKTNAEALAHLNQYLEREVAERTAARNRVWELSADLMLAARVDGVIEAVNPAWSGLLGWSEREIVGRSFMAFVHAEDRAFAAHAGTQIRDGETVARFELRCLHKDGSDRRIDWSGSGGEGVIYAVGRDVTAERARVAALQATEAQLRQAQKMEAVGQLTGGVAHDFNNILQVISGNLHLIGKFVPGDERVERRVQNALAAVSRGAMLSSQLLAFSRRQPLAPKVVHVGRLVSAMGDMLRRAIGEGVEVETRIAGDLWNTLADPAQVENAVLNLAINARDAMQASGKLTIEAGNAFLDDAYARAHAEVGPGQYVVLAVSDTGCGMTPEVIAQAFEPFFSTKPEGKGTGLGLSMVYGFAKQSGGHVKIYSEPGHGSTIKLYLPRSREREDAIEADDPTPVVGGNETILVAEDDAAVRGTAVEMLGELGYRVLKAADAEAALQVVAGGAAVDLLFTDVIMPGPLKSPELAKRVRELLPKIAVLFTSGYTENAIVHGGRLDPGVELLPKPYTRQDLARKIRKLLADRG